GGDRRSGGCGEADRDEQSYGANRHGATPFMPVKRPVGAPVSIPGAGFGSLAGKAARKPEASAPHLLVADDRALAVAAVTGDPEQAAHFPCRGPEEVAGHVHLIAFGIRHAAAVAHPAV